MSKGDRKKDLWKRHYEGKWFQYDLENGTVPVWTQILHDFPVYGSRTCQQIIAKITPAFDTPPKSYDINLPRLEALTGSGEESALNEAFKAVRTQAMRVGMGNAFAQLFAMHTAKQNGLTRFLQSKESFQVRMQNRDITFDWSTAPEGEAWWHTVCYNVIEQDEVKELFKLDPRLLRHSNSYIPDGKYYVGNTLEELAQRVRTQEQQYVATVECCMLPSSNRPGATPKPLNRWRHYYPIDVETVFTKAMEAYFAELPDAPEEPETLPTPSILDDLPTVGFKQDFDDLSELRPGGAIHAAAPAQVIAETEEAEHDSKPVSVLNLKLKGHTQYAAEHIDLDHPTQQITEGEPFNPMFFDQVLVRDGTSDKWQGNYFINEDGEGQFVTTPKPLDPGTKVELSIWQFIRPPFPVLTHRQLEEIVGYEFTFDDDVFDDGGDGSDV